MSSYNNTELFNSSHYLDIALGKARRKHSSWYFILFFPSIRNTQILHRKHEFPEINLKFLLLDLSSSWTWLIHLAKVNTFEGIPSHLLPPSLSFISSFACDENWVGRMMQFCSPKVQTSRLKYRALQILIHRSSFLSSQSASIVSGKKILRTIADSWRAQGCAPSEKWYQRLEAYTL